MFTSEMSQTEQPAIIRLLQEVEGTMVYMHIPRRVSIGELSAVFEANDLNILSFGVEPGMHKGSFCGYFLVTDNLDQPLTVQHQDQLIAALQRELHVSVALPSEAAQQECVRAGTMAGTPGPLPPDVPQSRPVLTPCLLDTSGRSACQVSTSLPQCHSPALCLPGASGHCTLLCTPTSATEPASLQWHSAPPAATAPVADTAVQHPLHCAAHPSRDSPLPDLPSDTTPSSRASHCPSPQPSHASARVGPLLASAPCKLHNALEAAAVCSSGAGPDVSPGMSPPCLLEAPVSRGAWSCSGPEPGPRGQDVAHQLQLYHTMQAKLQQQHLSPDRRPGALQGGQGDTLPCSPHLPHHHHHHHHRHCLHRHLHHGHTASDAQHSLLRQQQQLEEAGEVSQSDLTPLLPPEGQAPQPVAVQAHQADQPRQQGTDP
ncbi:hypothetical protein QJQ45_015624, partial [Haematococcus lacustris]